MRNPIRTAAQSARSLVPQTARTGSSQSSHDRIAKGLGYFSIALGVTELLAPQMVSRAAGLAGRDTIVSAYGAGEIATGVAILSSHNPEPWVWARVAGDMADVATVATGMQQDNTQRGRGMMALAALAAVTMVDVVCASGLN